MKPRRLYGDKNICGANIERLRKERGLKQRQLAEQMQIRGVDIHLSSLSKIEGQQRAVTDVELKTIADILRVDIRELFP